MKNLCARWEAPVQNWTRIPLDPVPDAPSPICGPILVGDPKILRFCLTHRGRLGSSRIGQARQGARRLRRKGWCMPFALGA